MPLGEPPKIDSLEELEVRLDFFNWANNDRLRQPFILYAQKISTTSGFVEIAKLTTRSYSPLDTVSLSCFRDGAGDYYSGARIELAPAVALAYIRVCIV
jgi:hypothetical protein